MSIGTTSLSFVWATLGALIMAPLLAVSAGAPGAPDAAASRKFAAMSDEFMKESLVLAPTTASMAGYHTYVDPKTGKTVALDAELDDMSLESMAKQRAFYAHWRERFRTETPPASLSPQDAAEWQLIDDQIGLSLLEFDKIQNYRHNPTVPVELIGNAPLPAAHAELRAAQRPRRPRPFARRADSAPARSGEGVSQRRRPDLRQNRHQRK